MKTGFYTKLAWNGIRKNKRLYIPYIMTCVGMVMMYYIILFLTKSPVIQQLPGSITLQSLLEVGSWIIAFFSMLFLFYSNSFLVRRRKKEFGLYNVLGMGKRNISKIMLWDSCIVAVIALGAGTGLGIVLSKLFELGMANLMSGQISYEFTISFDGIVKTWIIFGIIFVLILLNTLRHISLSNPIELLHGENTGEKPPKAKWFMTAAGIVILSMAYYLAVSIEDPVNVLVLFFIAVIMVIIATYLLFISGSVTLCRLLQKNKRYYYKANHFISVSSMAYRMNRNGTGLASICILLTMILVMLSSTTSLFLGAEESLRTRYPKDINIDLSMEHFQDIQEEKVDKFRKKVDDLLTKCHMEPKAAYDYKGVTTFGILDKDNLQIGESEAFSSQNMEKKSKVVLAHFVSLDDYNKLMGETQTLEEGQVLIYPFRTEYTASFFQINGKEKYRVKEVVDDFVDNRSSAMTVFPTIFIFVPDLNSMSVTMGNVVDFSGDPLLNYEWYYAFDLDAPVKEQISVLKEISTIFSAEHAVIESLEANRIDFYSLYGGLLFLGIMLSIVFLIAAVLIIYYKQISEGYEDQGRFEIMQKLGMTKQDIRKSINSQMLTVFLLPLITAGVHLCFAFPMISKMLRIFNLWNTRFLMIVTAGCFLIFGIFYMIVYRFTSNTYFNLVSGVKED